MLYNAYRGNVTEEKAIKIEVADNLVTQIKMLDFLINLCLDKQIINTKKYVKFGESLDLIARYVVSWKKSFNT